MNKLIYYDSELQRHLLNSQWSFNMHDRNMFDLDHDAVYAEIFSYTNFRRETMDVSQSIKMSVENKMIDSEFVSSKINIKVKDDDMK